MSRRTEACELAGILTEAVVLLVVAGVDRLLVAYHWHRAIRSSSICTNTRRKLTWL